ncbi:hypothetical protein JCM11251_006430 [Rhodosporidiobolus azoricus]
MPSQSRGPSVLLLLLPFLLLIYLTWSPSSSPKSDLHHHPANPKQPVPVLNNQAGARQQQPQLARPLPQETVGDEVLRTRIVAVGDIHGDMPHLTRILRRAELIDMKGQWIGGDSILVQTGDIVDRGKDTIAIYRFFQTLRPQAERAGGAVVSLLGNHEIMNALGDWRYVTKEDIASFGGERNRRLAMSTGWLGQDWRTNYSITARVPYLHTSFPPGVPIPAFPRTPVGESDKRFLSEETYEDQNGNAEENPFAVAAASFVHGGITPEYLSQLSTSRPVEEINRIGSSLLFSLLSTPAAPLGLPRSATPEQRLFWSEQGPMWNREWAIEDEEEICDRVGEVARRLRVRRLVMGHTPQFGGIMQRCEGKVLLIDTGISRAYGGPLSSLEILHTLTPPSHLSLADALSLDLISLSDPTPEETLKAISTEERVKWVEREVVRALYTDGKESVELVREERVVELPAAR